ncbi:DUF2092 domain-containing protein [Streptosporangium sp. NPDC023615]|uniref:LolA family protein n=1 Tax=Streptosporangium sp. NPDC023615 TaxID=3154794 RepID=UPI003419BAEA
MRWGVPVVAVAALAGAIGAGPVIAAVQGDPVLPERTAEQLLASAARAGTAEPKPMSGTVMQTASLGLPGLPDLTGMSGTSPAALLAGSHELKVWYGGADKIRLAMPGRMSETDLIVNGDQVWLWQSDVNKATRVTADGAEKAGEHGPARRAHEALPATTPQQLARTLLERVGRDTVVGVSSTEKVADRAAYQLAFAPKDPSSLIREVKLALDGETMVPLRVQVYAKSAAEPAFEVGFTSVTFSPPAAENFAFTPPAGAKVDQTSLGELTEKGRAGRDGFEDHERLGKKVKVVGSGWTTVAVLPVPEDLGAVAKPGQDAPAKDAGGQDVLGHNSPRQDATAIADALRKSATPISGPWGSGQVVRTKLVSALLTDDGRLLVGAVTPERLVEAAGRK